MSQGFNTSLDDTSSNITYTGTWNHTSWPSIYHLYQNTDSYSDEYGNSANLQFYGSRIEYWGNQDTTRCPCTITLDGRDVANITSYAPSVTDPVILYYNYDLNLGYHTLVITVLGQQPGMYCEIDRFVVGSAPTSSTSSTNAPTSNTTPSASSSAIGAASNNTVNHSATIGVIIGSVLGAVALVCLLGFIIWLYRHQKRIEGQDRSGANAGLRDATQVVSPFTNTAFTSPLSDPSSGFRSRTKGSYNRTHPLAASAGVSNMDHQGEPTSDISTTITSTVPPPTYQP